MDKSLVKQQPSALEEARFGLLETTRDFARERLREAAEEASLRDAHARWMLDLARRSEQQLAGGDQMGWTRILDAEHGNLLAALEWARTGGDLTVGLATAAAAARYWSASGAYRKGRRQLQALLDQPTAVAVDPSTRTDALTAHGMLCHLLCDFPAAEKSLEDAMALLRQLDDRPRLANLLNHLGWVAALRSQLERAEALSAEALALHRELADNRGVAVALNNLGWAAFYRGDASRAEACFFESLAMRRAADDDRGVVFTLVNHAMIRLRLNGGYDEPLSWIEVARRLVDGLAAPPLSSWVLAAEGAVAARRGQTADGIASLREASIMLRETGSADGLAWVLLFLGEAYEAAGDYGSARTQFEELLATWQGVGTLWGAAEGLRSLAHLAHATGDAEAAGSLYGQSLDLSEQIGARAIAEACRAALTELSD